MAGEQHKGQADPRDRERAAVVFAEARAPPLGMNAGSGGYVECLFTAWCSR
jgi:hypothetical protein